MRDITWRMGFTLLTLIALAVLGLNASCSPAYQLLEQALGQTPEKKIARYLEAVSRGDRSAALALWRTPASNSRTLSDRRNSVTETLLARGPGIGHRMLDLTWWRTCCEPAVIDDAAQAGGVRARVAIRDRYGAEEIYTFDLLVPGGYWGDAAGNPLREWVIVDLYPEGMQPLAWQFED
jgi:hypothetical protein